MKILKVFLFFGMIFSVFSYSTPQNNLIKDKVEIEGGTVIGVSWKRQGYLSDLDKLLLITELKI